MEYNRFVRALMIPQSVDTFVSHMARDESDRTKRAKLDALQLSDMEWDRANLFLSLLKVSKALFVCLLPSTHPTPMPSSCLCVSLKFLHLSVFSYRKLLFSPAPEDEDVVHC